MSDSLPLASDWIVLTAGARAKAQEYLKKEGREVVRITFDPNGKLGLELDKLRPGDRTFVQGDVTVAVVGAVADFVKGLSVDFDEKQGGFAFSGTATALDPVVGKKA